MRAYIDTNIYDYVALRHPVYGAACKKILEDVFDGKIEAYGSILVPIEIHGSLCEVDARIASRAVIAYFSLPVSMVPIDGKVMENASEIAVLSEVSYDSVHAAAMHLATDTVITEDTRHWKRIRGKWKEIRKKIGSEANEIKIIRPLEYEGD